MSRNGAHHAAFRRRSVKVFEGATKVLMMRAPSESGADSGVEAGAEIGGSGAAAIWGASVRWVAGILLSSPSVNNRQYGVARTCLFTAAAHEPGPRDRAPPTFAASDQ